MYSHFITGLDIAFKNTHKSFFKWWTSVIRNIDLSGLPWAVIAIPPTKWVCAQEINPIIWRNLTTNSGTPCKLYSFISVYRYRCKFRLHAHTLHLHLCQHALNPEKLIWVMSPSFRPLFDKTRASLLNQHCTQLNMPQLFWNVWLHCIVMMPVDWSQIHAFASVSEIRCLLLYFSVFLF